MTLNKLSSYTDFLVTRTHTLKLNVIFCNCQTIKYCAKQKPFFQVMLSNITALVILKFINVYNSLKVYNFVVLHIL